MERSGKPETGQKVSSIEHIVWVDSGLSFASTWLSQSTIEERAKEWQGIVHSAGHVVFEDDDCVVLGLSLDEETDNWAGCIGIYKPCIVYRQQLGSEI